VPAVWLRRAESGRTVPGLRRARHAPVLRQMLPRLAHRHGTRLELVGPPSSAGLPDGMGGLLRESAP